MQAANRFKFPSIVIAACLSASCSGISVTKLNDMDPKTAIGVPYNLPKTTFSIAVTRRVISCNGPLKGQVVAVVKAGTSVDADARYTLRSNGWLNTSSVKSTYGTDGRSLSLSTTVTNQAGPMIADTVSTVASIAALFAAGAGYSPACSGKSDSDPDGIPYALSQIKLLQESLKKESDQLVVATRTVTLMTSQLTVWGRDADKQFKSRLTEAIKQQQDIATKMSADEKSLADYLERTSDTQTYEFPLDRHIASGAKEIPADLVSATGSPKWGTVKAGDKSDPRDQFRVYFLIEPSDLHGIVSAPLPETTACGTNDSLDHGCAPSLDIQSGVPVRFPRQSKLLMCIAKPCGTGSNEVVIWEGPVLQIGRVYPVPAKGGLFKSSTMDMTADGNGVPTMVALADTSAAAASVASGAKQVAASLAGIPAAIDSAKLAEVTAQSNLLQAKNTLATAKANNANQNELAPLQAETTLAQAKLTNLQAEEALQKALSVQNGAGF
ncbi:MULTISPECIES: hypothetical protein [Dyella]|uniref:Uncharacterized protein n=2 Tax=Dyella TaxID=231454 RepID=A0A4R0YRD7_9GAMM|nr:MULTISPECIES: hypothetical protein [Dyella]TBR36475.1 hypothetical protein EYV96_11050 [Dyella terrae]TCI08433.1 hypothetical protein EZM97_27820 [Dyella soli]